MKEATGELGNSLVVIISVAILIAFFYFIIYPIIDNNFRKQTSCEKAACETIPDTDGMVMCRYKNQEFKCSYKG